MNTMFDVILVNPPNPTSSDKERAPFISENLALGYLSASLHQHGANVHIVDCDLDELSADDISALVKSHNPSMVGITALARNSEDALTIAKSTHQDNPDIPIVLGGLHFTYCGEQIMKKISEITYVIRGEGELSISNLYNYIRLGNGNIYNIGGLIHRDVNNNVVVNPMHSAISDLDILPSPDRQILQRAVAKGIQPAIPMLASRGCYARCMFCNASKVYVEGGGRSWRHRSVKKIVDEMEYLVNEYGKDTDPVILFYDDTFIGPGKSSRIYASSLADEIISRQLNVLFETFLRADSFYNDTDLIAKLRKAGMVRTFMGIESSDDQELKILRKAVTTKQVSSAIINLKQNHVYTPSSGFIMFLPYSTFDTLCNNAKYLYGIGHASIWNLSTRLDVYGGNDFFEYLDKQGLITGSELYGGLYSYRFRNELVGKFSEYMNINMHPIIQRLDSSGRFIEFNYNLINYELTQMQAPPELIYNHNVPEILKKIHDNSYVFFIDSLDSFRKNEITDDLEDKKHLFLKTISNLIDKLENAYQAFLKQVDMYLEKDLNSSDSTVNYN